MSEVIIGYFVVICCDGVGVVIGIVNFFYFGVLVILVGVVKGIVVVISVGFIVV